MKFKIKLHRGTFIWRYTVEVCDGEATGGRFSRQRAFSEAAELARLMIEANR